MLNVVAVVELLSNRDDLRSWCRRNDVVQNVVLDVRARRVGKILAWRCVSGRPGANWLQRFGQFDCFASDAESTFDVRGQWRHVTWQLRHVGDSCWLSTQYMQIAHLQPDIGSAHRYWPVDGTRRWPVSRPVIRFNCLMRLVSFCFVEIIVNTFSSARQATTIVISAQAVVQLFRVFQKHDYFLHWVSLLSFSRTVTGDVTN